MQNLQHTTLVLNASYAPLGVVPWDVAITALHNEKASVVEEYDQVVRSAYLTMRIPAVIRLNTFVKKPVKHLKFSRVNIYSRDEHRCFGAGTLVLLASGEQKPIEEIHPGDAVIDATGNQTTVVATGSSFSDKACWVKFKGSAIRTLTTTDHPYLTPNGEYVEIGAHPEHAVTPRTIQFVRNKPTTFNVTEALPSDKWFRVKGGRLYHSRRGHEAGFPLTLTSSPELAVILGAFVADGSANKQNVLAWSLNTITKADLVKRVKEFLASVGLPCFENVDTRSTTDSVEGYSHIIAACTKTGSFVFRHLCGYPSYNKRTPWGLIGPYIEEYLYGLFRGDGSISKELGKATLSTTSKDVAFSTQSMLWGLGMHPTIQQNVTKRDRPCWMIVLQAENFSIFMDKVMKDPVTPKERIYGDDSFVYRRVQTIELTSRTEVFNLETETHSYIANGLAVHNCQYCNVKCKTDELTYDHVIPRALGGTTVWTNIVACCYKCNSKKGGRTPEQAKMKLLKKPVQPKSVPKVEFEFTGKPIPEQWRDYVYWSADLSENDDTPF